MHKIPGLIRLREETRKEFGLVEGDKKLQFGQLVLDNGDKLSKLMLDGIRKLGEQGAELLRNAKSLTGSEPKVDNADALAIHNQCIMDFIDSYLGKPAQSRYYAMKRGFVKAPAVVGDETVEVTPCNDL